MPWISKVAGSALLATISGLGPSTDALWQAEKRAENGSRKVRIARAEKRILLIFRE
jgi:hypothetical protein